MAVAVIIAVGIIFTLIEILCALGRVLVGLGMLAFKLVETGWLWARPEED